MIQVDEVATLTGDDLEQLMPLASDTVSKFGENLTQAFAGMQPVWRVSYEGQLLFACCVLRTRSLLGPKAEVMVLAGRGLQKLPKTQWLELRLLSRRLHTLYPGLQARVDVNHPEHAKFAEFFGFRLAHQRNTYNIYEAS